LNLSSSVFHRLRGGELVAHAHCSLMADKIVQQQPSTFFHISHCLSTEENYSCYLNSHWLGTIVSSLSILYSCEWPDDLKSSCINDINFFLHITPASAQTSSLSLKMEAVRFSEKLEHLTTTWCRNPMIII
jgi:hypothetical protein